MVTANFCVTDGTWGGVSCIDTLPSVYGLTGKYDSRTGGDNCGVSLHARTVTLVPKEDHTKVRSLRSDKSVWEPFSDAVGDGNRAAWLNDFMRWVNEHPEEWTAARELHRDDLARVLAQFLAWYQRKPGARLPTRPSVPTTD